MLWNSALLSNNPWLTGKTNEHSTEGRTLVKWPDIPWHLYVNNIFWVYRSRLYCNNMHMLFMKIVTRSSMFTFRRRITSAFVLFTSLSIPRPDKYNSTRSGKPLVAQKHAWLVILLYVSFYLKPKKNVMYTYRFSSQSLFSRKKK